MNDVMNETQRRIRNYSSTYSIRSFMTNLTGKSKYEENPECIPISKLKVDDVIIVVMGPTGVGKSNFIHILTENESAIGHGLESYTSKVSAYRLEWSDDINVVLVDTPGFDDTHYSDQNVFENIAKWLKRVGKRGLHVSRFLYLHRITDNRLGSGLQKRLEVFQQAAGEHFFSRVTLMTTMWPESADTVEMEESERKEAELREEYWEVMIQKGSKVMRFTNTRESARHIVDSIITAESETHSIIAAESETQRSQIQQELADQVETLPTTEAVKEPDSYPANPTTFARLANKAKKLVKRCIKGLAKLINRLSS